MTHPQSHTVKPGDIVLVDFPDGKKEPRPAVVLFVLPGHYKELLICAVSTQMHQYQEGFDLKILKNTRQFHLSGLKADSVVRLLSVERIPEHKVKAVRGCLLPENLALLQERFKAALGT